VSVIFRYPFDFPYIEEVELPNPTLGNSTRLNTQAQYKQDMRGGMHSHRKQVFRELLLTFVVLNQTERDGLQNFYRSVIGNIIRYEDHDGQVWRGHFSNTNLAITVNRECDYSTTLEFTGVLV